MPRRIFIANRGEIVARVARTAAALGIETVAVAARKAVPRFLAQAVTHLHLIERETADFYLNATALIALAQTTDCDALHPGYGFLAENAAFAAQVSAAGLTWIGPAPQTIAQMGDKHTARQIAHTAQVAVVPAVCITADNHIETTKKILTAFTTQHGMPAILKAVAGGGGKAMRVVHDAQQLPAAVQATAREAQTLYHNTTLLVEKYLPTPRHIEVQIVGDQHGQLAVLGERECSLQRRFQKIIEETPAPRLSEAVRQNMYAAALRLARHVAYHSTGTVEFLFDSERDKFYFLEMNTRLQVEHTITEEVFCVDLVAAQIKIAAGERLPPSLLTKQPPRGHSIQVRIYAEDAAQNFLPAPGRLLALTPYRGIGIRWEIGSEANHDVSPFFDPLLAKLIATAENRPLAIARLQHTLARTFIAGVKTNLAFLQTLLAHQNFQAAQVHTSFITHNISPLLATMRNNYETRQDDMKKIAEFLLTHYNTENQDRALTRIFASPLQTTSDEVLILQHHTANNQHIGCGIYADSNFFHFVQQRQTVTVGYDGHVHHATPLQMTWETESRTNTRGTLTAPVPGRVAAVHVTAGDTVQENTVCLSIESMKMEFALKAPGQGQVQEVNATVGDLVSDGEVLVVFAPAEHS